MARGSWGTSGRSAPAPPVILLLLLLCITRCEAARALRQSKQRNSVMNALFKLNFISRAVEPAYYAPPPAAAAGPSSDDGTEADSLGATAADGGSTPFCVNPPNAPASSTPPFTSTSPSSTTPSVPDQPFPPLPPITPVPPSFEPSPPADGGTPSSTPGLGGPPVDGTPSSTPGLGGPPVDGTPSSTPGLGSPPADGTPSLTPGLGSPPADGIPSSTPPQLGPSPPGSAPPSPIVVVPSPPDDSGPGSGSGSGSGSSGGFIPPIIYPPPLAPPMAPGSGQQLWCVAKPTVPDPILQEAMDYACGSGAECTSMQPAGACFQPDTVLAHASFAFNSYWQMTRSSGGTCDFGGTATLVTRDPSYDQCEFNLV